MQGIVSGDPRVFAKRNYQRLRHPTPDLEAPNDTHVRGSFLANASYTYLNDGQTEASNYLASEGFLMDSELSTNVGVVATKDGKAYVGFRGAQSQAENPAEHAMSQRDITNVKRVLGGKRVHSDGMYDLIAAVESKHGGIEGVYGYSLGGQRVVEMAHAGVLDSVSEVSIVNPLLGPREIARGVPKFVDIGRTIEDFASGPALSLALQKRTISPKQVTTVRGIDGSGSHNLDHFFPGGERGETVEQRMLSNPATREEALRVLQGEHTGLKGAGINLASVLAADRIVNAIAPKQKPVAKEVETGMLGGALTGIGKEALKNSSSIKAAARATARGVLTGSTVVKGAGTVLAGAAVEIPGAAAGIVAGAETTRALRNKLDDWDPNNNTLEEEAKDELADVIGGAVGGVAAAIATDAVVATAGVAAALVTGTEIGAAFGSLGGPVGWVAGAAGGAVVGLGIWAISSIFGG